MSQHLRLGVVSSYGSKVSFDVDVVAGLVVVVVVVVNVDDDDDDDDDDNDV